MSVQTWQKGPERKDLKNNSQTLLSIVTILLLPYQIAASSLKRNDVGNPDVGNPDVGEFRNETEEVDFEQKEIWQRTRFIKNLDINFGKVKQTMSIIQRRVLKK